MKSEKRDSLNGANLILIMMNYEASLDFAKALDDQDPLQGFRDRFHIPKKDGKEVAYFCGNSLGLQPKSTSAIVNQELADWAELGVDGHLNARNPWYSYHEMLSAPLAKLVGAKTTEVVAMNALTVNLHLLLTSFYNPSPEKHKILTEYNPFPSDWFALESQVRIKGFKSDDAIVEMIPKEGSHTVSTEAILSKIEEYKDELALAMFGGVNYYTGQCYDMKAIAAAAKANNITVGFDLAHGIGNVKLNLHDWDVDFAAWCSYKYLNSFSGGVGGVFINEKHFDNPQILRMEGWWGHNKESRFKMEKGFDPIPTSEGWQLSNAPVISMAAHKAALDIFEEAGMDALCEKRDKLTGYLEFVISNADLGFEIITPSNVNQRGCQLSILTGDNGKAIHERLTKSGVVTDWRHPNVIRAAPVPLYNSYEDVYKLGVILREFSG